MIKNFILELVPPQYRFIAVDIKNSLWGGFKEIYYSQNGEDIIINKIFSSQKEGFYVDVGAHHPKRYSNTYLLYKKGWRGINIDPNPLTIKLFKKSRKNDINLQCGISGEKKELSYYNFSDPAMNSFSEAVAKELCKKKWIKLLDVNKIDTYTLGDVLERYLPVDAKVDLLNIDTEGLDIEVLKSNNWNKFKPSVIVVEDHSYSPNNPSKSEIYNFLSNDYNLHSFLSFSLVFIKK